MKLSLIIYLFIFGFSIPLFADTPKSGTISEEWDLAGSPYIIVGDITVDYLKIHPGVYVKFSGNFKFEVNDILIAEGFHSDSIIFIPTAGNTQGWQGIKFKNGSNLLSSLSYCRIEKANGQGISVDQSNPSISNCRIVRCNGNGIFLRSTTTSINNLFISDNSSNGILLDDVELSTINTIISRNALNGINSSDNNDSTSIINTVVADNGAYGFLGAAGKLRIRNSIIFNNLSGISTSQQFPDINFSNIQGDSIPPGTGNMNIDPEFSSASYELSNQSPCIDAGDPDSIYNDLYFPPSEGSPRNDIGAYGGPYAGYWYPPLYLKPSNISFGRIRVDSIKILPIKIFNYRHNFIPGIFVKDILFTDTDSLAFASTRESFFLSIRDSLEIGFIFTPDSERTFSSEFVMETSEMGRISGSVSGEGVLPHLLVLNNNLIFGDVFVHDSSSLGLPILNTGTDTLTLLIEPPSDPTLSIGRTNLKINPDISIDTLRVTFKPDSPQIYLDSLIIYSDDIEKPRTVITLSGKGKGPVISVDKPNIEFGSIAVGLDSSIHMDIRNTGNDTLIIENLVITQADTTYIPFKLVNSPAFPFTLLPSNHREITISFTPDSAGTETAGLEISSNDLYNRKLYIGLMGVGLAPQIVLSTNIMDFGSVSLGSDSSMQLLIQNKGNDTLRIDSLIITQTDSAIIPFELIDPPILPKNILADSSLEVTVKFSPNHTGSEFAELGIFSNDLNYSKIWIELTGIGLVPQIEISTQHLDFGSLPLDSDSSLGCFIYNHGKARLIIFHDSLNITGDGEAAFHIFDLDNDIVIEPGDSSELIITFAPTFSDLGPNHASFEIISNDPLGNSPIIQLTGLAFDNFTAEITPNNDKSTIPAVYKQFAVLAFDINSRTGVDSAFCFYREGGKSLFKAVSMIKKTSTLWDAEIDSTEITERGLEYYLRVHHGWRVTEFPQPGGTDPQAVPVHITDMVLPAETQESVYQMLSLPFETQDQTIGELFSDDLGSYDQTRYRFFDCTDGEGYTELTEMSEILTPGKAVWLITRNTHSLTVSDVTSLRTDTTYTLNLHAGWNMIASPYAFPINWSTVSDSLKLRFYDGTDWPFETVLNPYQGYAVHSAASVQIDIDPRISAYSGVFSKTSKPVRGKGWQIHISAADGKYMDQYNTVGVMPDARMDHDIYDAPEPPPIGEFVQLYLISKYMAGKYSNEFRPDGNDGYVFTFVLNANTGRLKTISFRAENLPEEFDWTVIGMDSKVNYQKESIKTSINKAQFQLIVGNSNYISDRTSDFKTVPSVFRLYPNFPNPFNSSTSIKFDIPNPTRLSINIFNILGQKVISLKDNEPVDAGYYNLNWNGTDRNGKAVSSGIYILQLKSADFEKSVKMILQK